MVSNFRFAIASDLHIALPHTIRDIPQRFHLVEFSIRALEVAFQHLEQLDLDFLLLPGDLTQDGEPDNHRWLQQRLAALPFPVCVVPGNHDILQAKATQNAIGCTEFPRYYQQFGYQNTEKLYYTCEIFPGVQLIALNSNQFDEQGKQLGYGLLDEEQLTWLEQVLVEQRDRVVLVMVHHNAIAHLPGQATHPLGRRYAIENSAQLLAILKKYNVKLLLTGHLHVQDIAERDGIHEITTGSLVSYPHPYRVLEFDGEQQTLKIKSYRVAQIPGYEDLPGFSREFLAERSAPLMAKLATLPPLELPLIEAEQIAANLRYFWADVAAGDALFDFPRFSPEVRQFFEAFGVERKDGIPALIDNQTTLPL
ncbi:MAG: metallophosphoesterase [Cyanobacteriota bacterium]|nr:metallophosphoesterase [Cyanobacteriota bacterium]